ncbi:putative DEAD/DEAH box helicase [Chiua virens]|nr:putative DEAD/DEAH box helicase [Chiua virens]
MFEPAPFNYYISVVSERWLYTETKLPISFKHLILPEKFPPPTPLLHLQPLPPSPLNNKEYKAIYSNTIQTFNKIQTKVAPTGSGKTICAEFALLKLWNKDNSRVVCVEPYQEMVDQRVAETRRKFSGVQEKGDVIVCTPSQKNVQTIALIADEIQLVGGEVGPTHEVIISRMRIVACGVSFSNARDLGEWIGAPSHVVFNFSPSLQPLDLDTHLQSFTIPHCPALMTAMSKLAYLAIVEYAPTKPVIIFISSRHQCCMTVDDLLFHCTADENPDRFLNIDEADLQPHLDHISDKGLVECLKHGIGYYHEAQDKQDKVIVERLFASGAI